MGLFNKSENWWLRLSLVLTTLFFLSLYASINRQVSQQIKSQSQKIDSLSNELVKCQTDKYYVPGGDIQKNYLQNQIDSLSDELFYVKTINGRYELTFDYLKEVDPKLGKKMEIWMSHNTE